MCGIVGWVGDAVAPAERERRLRRMAETVRHRGPDDDGFFVSDQVGLGVRRLSIIDVDGGRQPIRDEAGTAWVVQNGEIYNYRELRRRLSPAHAFATQSDTEVIVHAYEEHGEACVGELRGMFAFALWDARARRLLIAVDRLGIKPLYYAETEHGLVFGSELKCLLASGRVSRELDYDALLQYFTLSYIPPPRTIFRVARKLPPAHLLTWTPAGGVETRAYWDVPVEVEEHHRPIAELRAELRERLRDAVRSHLVSDVPLGAFLSGGIDSSAVVALMSEVGQRPVKTFTVGFEDPEHDERAAARRVAERYRTEHHELVVEPEGVELLPRLVASFDEPFADPAALPTYYVSKLAREHVTVALSGDGGDELFLGYRSFQGLEAARYLGRLPRFLHGTLAAVPGRWTAARPWAKRAADTLLPPPLAHRSKITVARWDALAPLLSAGLRETLAGRDPYAPVDERLRRVSSGAARHPLAPFVYAGLTASLAGQMLVKVDRMSMAHSLEVRVPLLDHVLVEFASRIPIGQRFPRWRLKGLFKDTLADALPPAILDRSKHGFTVPLARWFRGDLRSFAADILLGTEARQRGFLDPAAVQRLLGLRPAIPNAGGVILSLLVFELWCRRIGSSACAS